MTLADARRPISTPCLLQVHDQRPACHKQAAADVAERLRVGRAQALVSVDPARGQNPQLAVGDRKADLRARPAERR